MTFANVPRLAALLAIPEWRFSLRTLLVMVVLAAVLPSFGVAIIIGANAVRVAEQAQHSRLEDTAHALAAAVDRDLERVLAILSALSASRGLEVGDLTAFDIRAQMVFETSGLQVEMRRPDGTLLTPPRMANPVLGLIDPGLQSTHAAVLASKRAAVSDVLAARTRPISAAVVMIPILHDGVVIGTLETLWSPDQLTATLRRGLGQQGGLAVLVDPMGRIAAASRALARRGGQIYAPEPQPETSGWFGRSPLATVSTELERARGWRLFFSTDVPLPVSRVVQMLRQIILASLSVLLLTLGFVALVGRHVGLPLRGLSDLARNVASGVQRLETAMAPSLIIEFEDLRQAMLRADAVLRRRGAAERMALREARTSQELLMSVVNGTAESIHVKDLDQRYVLVNRAGLLAGAEPRAEWQVLGRAAADLFPPTVARRIEAADRRVLSTGMMTSFEQEYVPDPASGVARWVAMTVAPWKDAQGRVVGVVSVGRDITQKRLADQRMRAVQADLLRATRLSAMGAMASGLAHELNQPLAAATNFLNAGGRMLDRAALGDQQAFAAARSAVADSARQLLRAGAIVRRLRDFVERGEVELQSEDLGDLLRVSCDLARSDGVCEGIDLRIDLNCGSAEVLVDRTQIQQVLLNLIRNAAEAIIGSGQVLPGLVVVSASLGSDSRMYIDVSDNGPGLSQGIAERLFEPFVSSKLTGMGIGLSICRTIIEGHGGSLTAEPGTTEGMRFRIALPALNPTGGAA